MENTICWKVLIKFLKIFIRILLKCIIFAYFSKNFNKRCVNFLRVWTKNANCWEILRKFSMKFLLKNWIFILFLIIFFENLLLKIEPSEITPVFYNNIFGFGEGISLLSPLATPLIFWTLSFKRARGSLRPLYCDLMPSSLEPTRIPSHPGP